MKIADLPDFDPAKYLKTEEDIAAYGVPILTGRKRTLRNLNFHKRLISFNNL